MFHFVVSRCVPLNSSSKIVLLYPGGSVGVGICATVGVGACPEVSGGIFLCIMVGLGVDVTVDTGVLVIDGVVVSLGLTVVVGVIMPVCSGWLSRNDVEAFELGL